MNKIIRISCDFDLVKINDSFKIRCSYESAGREKEFKSNHGTFLIEGVYFKFTSLNVLKKFLEFLKDCRKNKNSNILETSHQFLYLENILGSFENIWQLQSEDKSFKSKKKMKLHKEELDFLIDFTEIIIKDYSSYHKLNQEYYEVLDSF